MTFIAGYCYDCSIALLVIVNLVLYLISELHFLIDTYVQEKT